MYQKAKHFGDNELAMKILENDDPVAAKSMGKRVQYFKSNEWNSVKDQYMHTGITAKFQQNKELANFLIDTGTTTLAEASPYDKYWGVGCSLSDCDLWDPIKWKGANTLGKLLGELRDNLRKN